MKSTPTTYSEAAGPIACTQGGAASPFIIDLPPDQRGDVELAMRQRLVAVEYDCEKLVLLPDCEISGEYQYAGLTPREQVISIGDDFEVRANLPLGGLSLAGQIGGDFQRGNTLDIALAIVGQRASVKRRVLRSDLVGECKGATHFIRSAMVGAFAMEKGTRGRVRTAAQVFGIGAAAQSHDASHVINRDGSLEACRKGDGRDDELPGCAAPLRVELRPLVDQAPDPEAATATEEETLALSCPAGARADDRGKCVKAEAGGPYVCAVADPADCEKQCELGSMASCTILARSYQLGRGVGANLEKAATLYVKACKARVAPACGRVGELMLGLRGKEQEGLGLLQKACADGWSDGCFIAGTYLARTAPGSQDVVAPTLRACKLGSAEGCWSMGHFLKTGLVPKDEARSTEFFRLACEGGARRGCSSYGRALIDGAGVAQDEQSAVRILTSSCDQGFASACNELSLLYFTGKGVPQDVAKGTSLLERACESPEREQCATLGMRYRRGVGIPADREKALRYFTRACEAGDGLACKQADELKNPPAAPVP